MRSFCASKPLSSIGIGAIAVIIGLGVQYAAAQWSAAPTAPPGNNVAAPINVSSANQAKAGALTLGSATDEASQASSSLYVAGMGGIENLFAGWLTVTGTTTLDGRIYIARGLSTTSGTVLTNNGQGYASWQPLPGLPTNVPPHATFDLTTPGTYLFEVPAGVNSVSVKLWGAGGSGGGYTNGPSDFNGGGGGGGAYAANTARSVYPGDVFLVTVGAGTNRGNGGDTSFVLVAGPDPSNSGSAVFSAINIIAGGGASGGDDDDQGYGGAGGVFTNGVISLGANGGNGTVCCTLGGSNGGAGGSSPNGGAGGAESGGTPNNGVVPGGGGGGAGNGDRNAPGGYGANGEALISY